MNRLARLAFPHDHRLALIGNADRRHIARPCARLAQHLYRARQLARQNFGGIVFHPSRLRVELLELMLRNRGNRAGFIKKNGTRTRRALVQCKNVCHGEWSTFGPKSITQPHCAATSRGN